MIAAGDVREGTVNKLFIPNGGNQIVARLQAYIEESRAKLNANIKSLFEPKTTAAPQRVVPLEPAGSGLPKLRVGGFRDRLSAPRRSIST